MQEQKPLQKREPYTKPVIDLTAGYAFFDGLVIKCGSLKYLELDSTCPVIPEEQIFVCRQMTDSILRLRKEKGRGLSVLDVGTGSGVLAIYADRILNSSEVIEPFSDTESRANEIAFDLLSVVSGLDCLQVAVDAARKNAEINQSRNVKILDTQFYSESSIDLNSQDIILMNPPFNPTPDYLLDRVATLGSTNNFCLGKLIEWVTIAKSHLCPGGLIIGCVLSPVDCDGNVLAVEELKKILECESGVRYIHINDGIRSTKDFLDKQYANYIALVPKDEQDKLSNWIKESSNTHPGLAFIYFEASNTDQTCKGDLTVDPRLEGQYIRDWAHRIFLHSILLLNTVYKMEDPLVKIDFAEAEDTIRQLKSKNDGDIDDKLSSNVIHPIAQYIKTKINSHYNLKSSKYLNEYIKNNLFLELVLFCPDDIKIQPELFSFALILPLSDSIITDESANDFFNRYYSLLDFLYTNESSIFFSKNFLNTPRSDEWLPKQNNLIRDGYPIISKDDHLISFSSEIGDDINISVTNIPYLEKKLAISSSSQSSNKIYFCSDSGYVEKISKTEQENDVFNACEKAHYGLKNLKGFEKDETFMVVIPIYTRTNHQEGYTVTGGFLLHGEFSDFVSINEHKDEIRRMLRDFSLDLKQDFTPVIAGYAYHRSGDKRFYESRDAITHGIQGFWSLIRPGLEPEMLQTIQDICYLQSTSYELERIDAIPTKQLRSFVNQPLSKLINYLINAAALLMVGKDSFLLNQTEKNIDFTSEIKKEIADNIESLKNKIQVTYMPPSLENENILGEDYLTISSKLILTAINNAVDKISIFEKSQKITILVEHNQIIIVNNFEDNKERKPSGNITYLILKRLCERMDRNDMVFRELSHLELSNKKIQGANFEEINQDRFSSLWITQIPISLEIDTRS
jgi:hypothetical protein